MSNAKIIEIYLIRHAEAAGSWGEDPDPGLSELGQHQADELARKLVPKLRNKKFRVLSSPLLRARETAYALQNYMGLEIKIDPNVSEIPSPGIPLPQRSKWLQDISP